VWYSGSNFRYEKAQAGRYRQFDQVGIEVLGSSDALLDVEVISLGWRFFQELGMSSVVLMVNSLGDLEDRERYINSLREYFLSKSAALSAESRATLERNPLRVLDSKRAQDKEVIAGAPTINDFLSDEAREHFAVVCRGLDQLSIPYKVNTGLVRGLDYYQRTVFEFVSTALDTTDLLKTLADRQPLEWVLRWGLIAHCLHVMPREFFWPSQHLSMHSSSMSRMDSQRYALQMYCAKQDSESIEHSMGEA
jgi:histidyl-tRNA synthetase